MCAQYNPVEFQALTFHDAVPTFKEGRDNPRKYLERCLETIELREPAVRAWVEVNIEKARSAADASTKRYQHGRELSSIDGMPIGIKDMLATKDLPTRKGSPLFENDHTKQEDDPCVQALKAAGAIVLGKTVTTELAMGAPGPTTNPFDPLHTPGGSSSGSAAAIGARMIPAAIGTQMGGSLIRPASFCANFAIKPTMGALNRGDYSVSQNHIGVHAGHLEDMWRVSIEIAIRSGGDPGYPGLFGGRSLHPPTRPARLVVMEAEGAPELDGAAKRAFDGVLSDLRRAGVEIITRADHPLVEAFEQAISESLKITHSIIAYEMRWSLENLFDQAGGKFSDKLTTWLDDGRKLTLADYRMLLTKRDAAKVAHLALMPIADAVISPSSVGPAPKVDTTGSPTYNTVTSLLGAPTITMPLLAVGGLPFGVQLIGQQHTDDRLAGIARWMTEAIPARSA